MHQFECKFRKIVLIPEPSAEVVVQRTEALHRRQFFSRNARCVTYTKNKTMIQINFNLKIVLTLLIFNLKWNSDETLIATIFFGTQYISDMHKIDLKKKKKLMTRIIADFSITDPDYWQNSYCICVLKMFPGVTSSDYFVLWEIFLYIVQHFIIDHLTTLIVTYSYKH